MSAATGTRDAAARSRYQPVTSAPISEWHRLLAAIKASNLAASDKAVYRLLLDKADYRTAELPARFAPRQAVIARETSLSLRQVKYATGHLRRHGWLTAKGKTAPGRTLEYSLAAGLPCDCTGRRHEAERVQPDSRTGATFGTRTRATNGCNAAGQSTVSTERQREERVERQSSAVPDWHKWPPGDVGPCARCCQPCRRYGEHGSPLCVRCQADLATWRAAR
jgi:hypothetical protein